MKFSKTSRCFIQLHGHQLYTCKNWGVVFLTNRDIHFYLLITMEARCSKHPHQTCYKPQCQPVSYTSKWASSRLLLCGSHIAGPILDIVKSAEALWSLIMPVLALEGTFFLEHQERGTHASPEAGRAWESCLFGCLYWSKRVIPPRDHTILSIMTFTAPPVWDQTDRISNCSFSLLRTLVAKDTEKIL